MVLVDGHADAQLPADDAGFTRGLAAFETLRSYGPRLFRLEAHLERLARSAAFMDVPCPLDKLRRDIVQLDIVDDQAVNLFLTPRHRVVISRPLDHRRVGRAIAVATAPFEPPPWLPGWVKHTSRAGWELAAARAGADELIFLDGRGHWTECSRSNLLAVRDGVAITPPLDGRILPGITRAAAIDAAREAGIELREAPLPAARYDELYALSTLKEIAPIEMIDGARAGEGSDVGSALRQALAEIVARETQSGGQ
ncbi:MAG: aminotransferase class IV family protein [Deltaproteobacteria bacterium]|nr:aminotransferase class IV family protein [Deltaproteobacteria bacterium]